MKEAPVAAQGDRSPWASINDMLVQNRCWLCEAVFPRGKQKKVFQVSNLLDYFSERMKREDGEDSAPPAQTDDAASEGDTSAVQTGPPPALLSKNLSGCYASFVRMVREDPAGEKNVMRREFTDNDVEVWMSGLVCGISPECQADLQLFITTAVGGRPANSSSSAFASMSKTDKDCPPGCGCDNPWPFLA